MAFVSKEDPVGRHSSRKIFLMTTLIHTFSRREPKRLLVRRVEKTGSSESFNYDFILLLSKIIFCNLIVHFVKLFKSSATEGI